MRPTPRVISLVFTSTGNYGEQLAWTYATPSAFQYVVNKVEEHAHRSGMGSNDTISMLTRMFHQRPNKPHPVTIEGGFQARRFKFLLTLETADVNRHNIELQFVSGYTEPCVLLDENTKLYFNRSTIFQKQAQETPAELGRGNLIYQTRLVKDTLVAKGQTGQSLNRVNEVFSSMQMRALHDHRPMLENVVDLRSTFQQGRPKLLLGKDDSLLGYVGRTLRTFEASARDMSMESSEDELARNALGMLPDANMSVDPFFSVLINQTDYYGQGGAVSYKELLDVWEIVHQNVWTYMGEVNEDRTLLGIDDTIEGYIVYHALRATASLMPSSGLRTVGFTWSGGDITYGGAKRISEEHGIDGTVKLIDKPLKNHLRTLNSTSPGGARIELKMTVDLYGAASAEISVNKQPVRRYKVPMWCSALSTQQITNDPGQPEENSRFFVGLVEQLQTHAVIKDRPQGNRS